MDELLYPDKTIPVRCPHCNEYLISKGYESLNLHLPVTFYKYVPIDAAEKILSEGSIKLMRPIEANDTFEFMPSFEGVASNKAIALDIIRQSKVLISSFSRSCHIPAMWSHYAARGAGVCLGFKTLVSCDMMFEDSELFSCNDLKAFPILKCISNPSIVFAPVLYMKKRIIPTNNLNSYVNSFLPACIKNISWEYEREFRLLLKEEEAEYVQNGQYFTKSVISLLDCIILGPNCRVNNVYMKKFLETKASDKISRDIPIYQAEYHPTDFTIITPGHEDTLENSFGEYHEEVPTYLTTGSRYSNHSIKAIYLGDRLAYQNSAKPLVKHPQIHNNPQTSPQS